MAILPLPPAGLPQTDAQGNVTEPWRRYYLSLEEAIPTDAPSAAARYWVSATNSTLTNEQNIGLLASGYLKTTTAIGTATPSSVALIPAGDLEPGGTFPAIDGSQLTNLPMVTTVHSAQIDFGSTPVSEGAFTILDPDVTAASNITGSVAYISQGGKSLDEMTMDGLDLKFGPGDGFCTLYARGMDGFVAGTFVVSYVIGT